MPARPPPNRNTGTRVKPEGSALTWGDGGTARYPERDEYVKRTPIPYTPAASSPVPPSAHPGGGWGDGEDRGTAGSREPETQMSYDPTGPYRPEPSYEPWQQQPAEPVYGQPSPG